MLDFSSPNIQELIKERKWTDLNEFDCLKSIYNYVRDEILFGYNIDDNIPASKVLKTGMDNAIRREHFLWRCFVLAEYHAVFMDLP